MNDILTVGQQVECKSTEIDLDKKRISLSIRALLPEEDEQEQDDVQDEQESAADEADEAPVVEETAEEADAE